MQTLSPQNRLLGLVGAIETGVGLWYFTNRHWANGIFYSIAVSFLIAVYLRRQRKSKGQSGGRRY